MNHIANVQATHGSPSMRRHCHQRHTSSPPRPRRGRHVSPLHIAINATLNHIARYNERNASSVVSSHTMNHIDHVRAIRSIAPTYRHQRPISSPSSIIGAQCHHQCVQCIRIANVVSPSMCHIEHVPSSPRAARGDATDASSSPRAADRSSIFYPRSSDPAVGRRSSAKLDNLQRLAVGQRRERRGG